MRAVLKKDHEKGGNIPSYKVLTVNTDGGVWDADEMYFYDYDEDAEYLCWEKRRYEIAKMVMAALVSRRDYDCDIFAARSSVQYADALITELKKGK